MEHLLFIGGKWIKSYSEETFPSINPANELVIGLFQQGNEEDVRAAVDAAESAYEAWSETPAPKRGEILLKVAQLLRKKKEELAKLETAEMGKVLPEARSDVQEAIDVFEYMAGEGRRLFGNTTPSELKSKFACTIRRPIGIVGLITPWNFPIAIPAWKLSAALICGNTVVFKPSSDTPLCAVELVKILVEAGVPSGVINMITGPGSSVGKEIVTNKKIRALSFTGSRDTGEWIAQNAGIKKVGLELGGKNAIIVMDDADLPLAIDGAVWSAFGTTGQRCTAASRIIVHEKIQKDFETAFCVRAKQLVLGPGLSEKTDIGPLVNRQAVEKCERYIDIGKKEGAKLLCGGKRLGIKGFFFEPTIFTNATIDMKISQQEIFGPVVSVISVKSLEEAIDVCNSIEYGLSSAIYTKNIDNAFRAIEKIEAGITYVNSSTIGSEVHLPFGGVKQSGTAREGGILGIDEFSEVKTVYIDYSSKLQKAQMDVG
ncbi:MAG: aldehyde dehydrogenase family protein [Candidatus Aenigmarchaeota archaeon]|nr:aldehyde dehydrogenase family protein [Candidatus Aenigmarchaeota archaeon]